MLGNRVLRSATPAAIAQEVYALLTAYQVLRIAISDACLVGGLDPDRASFTIAWQAAHDQVVQATGVIAARTTDLVAYRPTGSGRLDVGLPRPDRSSQGQTPGFPVLLQSPQDRHPILPGHHQHRHRSGTGLGNPRPALTSRSRFSNTLSVRRIKLQGSNTRRGPP